MSIQDKKHHIISSIGQYYKAIIPKNEFMTRLNYVLSNTNGNIDKIFDKNMIMEGKDIEHVTIFEQLST